MSVPDPERYVQALTAALTTLGMEESEATRVARGAVTGGREAAERAAESTRPEERPSAPVMVATMEAAKLAAIEEVNRFNIRAAAGTCDGAVCALACAAGCAVGCGIFGGAIIAFGTAGGTIGGSGVTISSTQGVTAPSVREMSMARYIYSGTGNEPR